MKNTLDSRKPVEKSYREIVDHSDSLTLSKSSNNSSASVRDNHEGNSRSNSPPSESSSRRPRRSTSQKVDYDLKKRRIIPSEDYSLKESSKKSLPLTETEDGEGNQDGEVNQQSVQKDVIELDEEGNAVSLNEPEAINDAINGATGLPLSQGPPEKVKKESLWNYKRALSSPKSFISLSSSQNNTPNLELKIYSSHLKTPKSESLTKPSNLRERLNPKDIHDKDRDKLIKNEREEMSKKEQDHHTTSHIKVKATVSREAKSKLFGQNSMAHLPGNSTRSSSRLSTPSQEVENDDFCSACLQSGSFLCCDTCPKSFHFLCLNPPLDPDNLPEGDWSCPQCVFKQAHQTITQVKKVEKEFIRTEVPPDAKLFGKLLFQLEATNSRQFKLPQSIKETFQHVRTGSRGQYCDEKEKEPLSERQLFGSPYGQCITKLDSYNPDIHVDQETGKLLICYKCGTTKMGTWDEPDKSRLIMRCDYCQTPWHLDCIPHVPRSSLKNLGTNWKCPLHAPGANQIHPQRRLARNQKYTEPAQSCGYKNNGEVDIILDEITAPGSKEMYESARKNGDFPPVTLLRERSVKLDFMDKVYRAKKVQRENELKCQEHLIDKLVGSSTKNGQDILSFVYFALSGTSSHLKKLWDFKELCNVAQKELAQPEVGPETLTDEELRQLFLLKKLLESKPKEDILRFLNLNK